jgi:hypothetical protein
MRIGLSSRVTDDEEAEPIATANGAKPPWLILNVGQRKMTLDLRTGWVRRSRFTLLPEAIRVEERGILSHTGEFRYDGLVSRSVKERKSVGMALFVFGVLAAIPIGFGWFAVFLSAPSFHVGTALFSIPALIALREVLRSFRHELLFLEKGDGGVVVRFSYSSRDGIRVEAFVRELKRRISEAKKK